MKILYLCFVFVLLVPAIASAGGFESGENTAIANARGGTGVVSRTDAAAMLFNPSLLAAAKGFQLTVDTNLLNQNLSFQRAPLTTKLGTTTFDKVGNVKSFSPIPFIAASYDFNSDFFTLGLSFFAPHSYANSCLTKVVDGKCITEKKNSARYMLIGEEIIVGFALVGGAISMDAGTGKFLIGAGGGIAFTNINKMDLFVDQISPPLGEPYNENSNFGGRFSIRDASDIVPAYNFGVTYISTHFHLGFSARPSLNWNLKGKFNIDLPLAIEPFVTVENDDISIQFNQAGSYRLGFGWFDGQHPADTSKHLYDIELNFVYEDWSLVDTFRAEPHSTINVLGEKSKLSPVFQGKHYRDTFSMRLGGSYAITKSMTLLGGTFIETAAQSSEYTNADFVSWERYSANLGFSYQVFDAMKLTLSYGHVFSPDREVTHGKIYQQIPLSKCIGPSYTNPQCKKSGTPPGTSQNIGKWTTSSQIIGIGIQVNL